MRARGAANKGARVAWVLFEMRTLSKAASEKRPDERRKDTSVCWDMVCVPEGEKQSRKIGEREEKVRVFHHPLGHPSKRVILAKAFALRIAIFLSELPTLLSSLSLYLPPSFPLSLPYIFYIFSILFFPVLCLVEMLMVTRTRQRYREISVTADDIFF